MATRTDHGWRRAGALGLVLALAVGCGGGDNGTPVADTGADVTEDAAPDVTEDAAPDVAPDVPGDAGRDASLPPCTTLPCARAAMDLVASGGYARSTAHRMSATLGQSTIHQSPMRSPGFLLRGGLVGTMNGRR